MGSTTSIWLLTLLTILLTVLYIYLKTKYNYWKRRNIPYDEPNLIFGNFYDPFTFKKDVTSYFQEKYNNTTHHVFGLYLFQRPYLLIRDPQLIKYVLVKDFHNFVPRSHTDSKNDPIGKSNLFSIKNTHHWRFIRSKVSPFFSSGKMRNTFDLLNKCGDQLTEHVQKHVNELIEIKDLSQKYTIDVIVSTAFGVEANSFSSNNVSEFSSIGKHIFTYSLMRSIELFSYFFSPLLTRIFNFKFFGDEATSFFRNVTWKIINARESSKISRPDLIDALIALKNNGSIIDKDESKNENDVKFNKNTINLEGDILVAQAAVFFTAGFETSSLAISFTLHSISYNPSIQIKLRKEIQSVIAQNGGKFTYDCLQHMKYLDACIKETLRLYPTLGFLDREALNTYTFPGTNITVDKGTPIIISLAGLQRDPQYFENPNVYDPERFNDNNKDNIVPYTYMPFGEGPRNCIGARFGLMSTKIGLVHILKDFELEICEKPTPIEINPRAVFLSPTNGIHLKFRPGTVYE